MSKSLNKDPCKDYLSDKDYLIHMIPHHQVAVDISYELQKISKNPTIHDILRKILWVQNREIMMMKDVLKTLPENISDNSKMNYLYINTISDFTQTAVDINAECKSEFFNPDQHKKHLKHMHLDEKMYLEHMIPHHQVAVDMSKRLLQHTSNDFMITFAYRIIRSQQEEISYMNNLLANMRGWSWNSKLIN